MIVRSSRDAETRGAEKALVRRAERALSEGLAPFVDFLDELPVAVFVAEASGAPFYANKAAMHLLGKGIDPSAAEGSYAQTYQAFIAGTDELYPEARLALVRALHGESSSIDDMEIHHPDRVIPIEVWGTPIRDAAGDVTYALTVFSDITDRRNAEAEAERALVSEREATRRLEELDLLRNEFVAMVAHDLRSPMSIALGFANTLVGNWEGFDDETRRDFVARIASATEHLSDLVDDILEVSRIESGQLQCELAPFDVANLVTSTVADRADSHRDRTYNVAIEGILPKAFGDERRQWQILTNLLTNAAKFSPEATMIDIRVRQTGELIEISVQDRGPGIPAEDLSKLFQKFSRLGATHKIKGTGLGLFICKSLIEAQGGTIEVQSAPGEGATFTYTIPTVIGDAR